MEFLSRLQNLNPRQKITAIIAGIIGLICLAAIVLLGIESSTPQTLEFNAPEQTSGINGVNDKRNKSDGETSNTFFIEILGQVQNPGVYELNKKIIILEALELAGGLTEDADLLYIHKILPLSELVSEHQKIYIPSIFENSVAVTGESESASKSSKTAENLDNKGVKININTASLEELISLPGIGAATAEKIISNRPYTSLEQLKDIQGIGEGKYNSIVTLITW